MSAETLQALHDALEAHLSSEEEWGEPVTLSAWIVSARVNTLAMLDEDKAGYSYEVSTGLTLDQSMGLSRYLEHTLAHEFAEGRESA